MAEVFCTHHPDIGAVGKCAKCGKPFCLECLDLETGKPLCQNCMMDKPAMAVPEPSVPTPSAPPAEAPKASEETFISIDDLNMAVNEPFTNKKEGSAKVNLPSAPTPAFKPPVDDPLGLFSDAPASVKPAHESPKPAAPNPFADLPSGHAAPAHPSEKQNHGGQFDLAGMMNTLEAAEQAAHQGSKVESSRNLRPLDKVFIKDLHAVKRAWLDPIRSLTGAMWLKFELLAARLRVPGYLLAAIIFALLVFGITFGLQQAQPPVAIVSSVPSIHIMPMEASQVSDLDITAFTDIQNHLGGLGFTQALQMTVPQLPSPNFFDVGLKPDEGTYDEILKIPNQIGPRVSFVTVFTNGVWYSTNGWSGTNQQLDYLVSEFYPSQTPEQLYDQHMQGVQKLKSANDWQVQRASQNRYVAALSDHLRWFLTLKNIPSYQADFALWH
jgi:hypothetical protein